MMTLPDNDTLNIQSPIVPADVFGHAAEYIESELTELITDIHLAGDYTGDDAINHAVVLADRCNRLQGYLFAHQARLVHQKKMRDYAAKSD